ncbi:MAG: PucR family transcriptional regulator [Eggerthellaceae bacterium]|jgi:purine catabolism regulator
MTTVSKLLELPKFQGSRLLAGTGGLTGQIVDICIMEVPDIEDYVRPGDFLLTTLYPISARMDELEEFIVRMKTLGLVGIAIKLNRYVTKIPDTCLQRADELSFPVVLLPPDANFSLMINDFLKENLRKKNKELEHRNQVNDMVMKILLQGGTPAAIAKTLAIQIKHDIVLFDRTCEVLGSYLLSNEWKPSEEEVIKIAKTFVARTKKVKLSNGYCILNSVQFGKRRIGIIAICAPEDFEITGLDAVTLQQFAIVFRISVQYKEMSEDEQRNRRNSLAFDLLSGKISNPDIALNKAATLGWKLAYPLTMLVCKLPESVVETSSHQEVVVELGKRVNRKVFGCSDEHKALWAVYGTSILILLSDIPDDVVQKLVNVLSDELAENQNLDVFIARSRNIGQLDKISSAWSECEYTLRLSQSLGNTGCARFQDLGVFRLIYDTKDKASLEAFCRDTIGKLIDYDERHASNLLETVEAVADSGYNLKAAAEKLFVHYNTIRYRYKLAQSLLEADFERPEEIQSVQLAIKVYRALPAFAPEGLWRLMS